MICLTYRCTQSAYLFSKPGHFFRFSERSRRGLACSRSVLQKRLLWKTLHCIIVILFWKIPAKEPVFNKVATSNFIYLTTCNFTLTQAFSPKFRISTSRGHKDSLSQTKKSNGRPSEKQVFRNIEKNTSMKKLSIFSFNKTCKRILELC